MPLRRDLFSEGGRVAVPRNEMSEMQPHERSIRSFVLRGGRITPAQKRAFTQQMLRLLTAAGDLFENAAGIVSLPGMMTGQILAGSPPIEAAKYQLLIMFLISAGTGLGSVVAVWIGSRRLFDERQRLRLDRLH
jgi:ABC-type iron transport system FetAB permease component